MNFYRIDWWCEICAQRLIEIQLKRIFTHNKLQIRERIYLARISRIDCRTVGTQTESDVPHMYTIYVCICVCVNIYACWRFYFGAELPGAQCPLPGDWMSRIINYAQNDKLTLAKKDKLLLVCWGLKMKRQTRIYILNYIFWAYFPNNKEFTF